MGNNNTKEYKGRWWLPANPEYKVAGILYYTPGEEIRLELIGSLDAEHPNGIESIMHIKREDIIHGKTSDGEPVSLIDNGCSVSFKGAADFSTAVYKARAIAIGLHINGMDDKRFCKSIARIPELSYWLYPSAVEQVWVDSENKRGIFIRYEEQKKEDREVGRTIVKDGLSVCLCRSASFNGGEYSFKPTFEQYTSFQVDSDEPVSFRDLYYTTVRFENFLSLATMREVGYSELRLYSEEKRLELNDGGIHYRPIIVDTTFHQPPTAKKIDRYKFLFTYNEIQDFYSGIIKKWFSKDEQFDAIRSHFLDSIDYHGPFSYINFLVVIQAVEGYGRRFLPAKISAYRKTLTKEERKNQLLPILSTVFNEFKDVKSIKQDVNLNAIVESRNYHSHLLPRRGQSLVSMEELYCLTDELRKVLVCCILSYLGLPIFKIDEQLSSTNNELFRE